MKNRIKHHSLLAVLFLLLSIAIGCAGSLEALAQSVSVTAFTAGSAVSAGSSGSALQVTSVSKKKKNKNSSSNNSSKDKDAVDVQEDGSYTSKEEVAAYLHEFGHLPDNFITKKEAKKLGWDSSQGNLDEVAPGKSIGGDYFGNYEGSLPEKNGRDYHECDIDYTGGYRSAKRIIYSTDGLIYYTEDHYQTFELLYGEE